jgi:hypothetical protein
MAVILCMHKIERCMQIACGILECNANHVTAVGRTKKRGRDEKFLLPSSILMLIRAYSNNPLSSRSNLFGLYLLFWVNFLLNFLNGFELSIEVSVL